MSGALSFIHVTEGFDASEMHLLVVVSSSIVGFVVVVVVITFWLTSLLAFYPARLNLRSSGQMHVLLEFAPLAVPTPSRSTNFRFVTLQVQALVSAVSVTDGRSRSHSHSHTEKPTTISGR